MKLWVVSSLLIAAQACFGAPPPLFEQKTVTAASFAEAVNHSGFNVGLLGVGFSAADGEALESASLSE